MGRLLIRLISDTHLAPLGLPDQISKTANKILADFDAKTGPVDNETVLILAGDIGDVSSDPYRRFLVAARAVYRHVLLVPGNHEYYTDGASDMAVVKEQLGRLARDIGITLLDNSDVVIGGYRFVGSTCWPLVPEEQFKVLKREKYGLVTRITKNSHLLDPSDFKRLHDIDVEYLSQTVRESREPCVVITHYPPSALMIDDRFEHSPQIPLHYNEALIDLVAKTQGATPLWCCGHCHTSKRFWTRGMNTLLVANCVEGGNYDPDFVIEL
jgi:Icc-related predicted phosphoesterase